MAQKDIDNPSSFFLDLIDYTMSLPMALQYPALTLRQVLAQPVVVASTGISLVCLTAFFFYCVRTGIAKTDKQQSWVLTLASSTVCTLWSLPHAYRFFSSGWDVTLLGYHGAGDTAMVCFFATYLVLDLALGALYYRNRIGLLTGWVHHTAYILFSLHLLQRQTSAFFSTAALLELPTIFLSLGSIWSDMRSDLWFGTSFLAIRLGIHSAMIIPLQSHRVSSLWRVAFVVLGLHLYWFSGFIRQQLRKTNFRYKSRVV